MTHSEPEIIYNPNRLLNTLMAHLDLHSDSALSRKLNVAKKVISNIRQGRLPVGASMLLWMQEASGIHIDELRHLLGDRRTKFRLNYSMHPH